MAEEKLDVEKKNTKTKRSVWSRVWNRLFRFSSSGDDFEKRLKYISKEEVNLLARIKRRSSKWRSTARNLIVLSVLLEVFILLLFIYLLLFEIHSLSSYCVCVLSVNQSRFRSS